MKDGNLTVLQDTEEQHNSYTLGPLKDMTFFCCSEGFNF